MFCYYYFHRHITKLVQDRQTFMNATESLTWLFLIELTQVSLNSLSDSSLVVSGLANWTKKECSQKLFWTEVPVKMIFLQVTMLLTVKYTAVFSFFSVSLVTYNELRPRFYKRRTDEVTLFFTCCIIFTG